MCQLPAARTRGPPPPAAATPRRAAVPEAARWPTGPSRGDTRFLSGSCPPRNWSAAAPSSRTTAGTTARSGSTRSSRRRPARPAGVKLAWVPHAQCVQKRRTKVLEIPDMKCLACFRANSPSGGEFRAQDGAYGAHVQRRIPMHFPALTPPPPAVRVTTAASARLPDRRPVTVSPRARPRPGSHVRASHSRYRPWPQPM